MDSRGHLVAAVALCVAAAVVAAGSVVGRQLLEVRDTTAPEPDYVRVGSRTFDRAAMGTFEVQYSNAPPLTIRTSGTVTTVSVEPGRAVHDGDPVLSVDGAVVSAFTGEIPLHRDLRQGDSGADVAVLARYLVATAGLPATASRSTTFGVAMTRAVRRFQAERTLPVTGQFSLGSVVYLPTNGAISTIDVRPGEIVESGQPIGSGARTRLSSRFAADNPSSAGLLGDAPLVIRSGTASHDLPSMNPTGDDLGAVVAFLDRSADPGNAREATENDDGSSSVRYTGVQVALRDPVVVGTVPVLAVRVSADGRQCVIRAPDRPGGQPVPVSVDAQPGPLEAGVALVPADLVGARVARDVSSAGQERPCA